MNHPVLRPWLEGVGGYTPGRTTASDAGRLASNEAPEPPAWLAGAHPLDGTSLNRYPDPTVSQLREEIAAHHEVDPEEVVVGNGSDELIFLLIQAYAAFTGSIAVAEPGYSLYSLCARRLRSTVHGVPLRRWHHDLDTMATHEVDIAFVCNPANPTGTVVSSDDLATFVADAAARLIVVDEAYIDFVTTPTFDSIAAARSSPRVVVLRTFSKAHALAGARVGYAIAHREIIQTLAALRLPFSVNSVAQDLGRRAVRNAELTRRSVSELVDTRRQVEQLLTRHGLEHLPSQASFVLVLSSTSGQLVDHFAAHGISVRPGRDLGIPDAVRLTIPSPAALPRLEQALSEFQARATVR